MEQAMMIRLHACTGVANSVHRLRKMKLAPGTQPRCNSESVRQRRGSEWRYRGTRLRGALNNAYSILPESGIQI